MDLSPAQVAALDHVRQRALRDRDAALARISAVLTAAAVDAALATLVGWVRRHGRVTLSFHPDRPVAGRSPSAGPAPTSPR